MHEFNLYDEDARNVIKAVYKGIDGHLEACYVKERGDSYFIRPSCVHCQVSDESMKVLIRRLGEAGHYDLEKRFSKMTELDEFTRDYIETALWSSCDDDNEPLDKNYNISDIDPETLVKMKADCADFQKQHGHLFLRKEGQAGHDFWLTRNGHGAGFWDGGWEGEIGAKLTRGSKKYGEFNLYVGDDGKIYS